MLSVLEELAQRGRLERRERLDDAVRRAEPRGRIAVGDADDLHARAERRHQPGRASPRRPGTRRARGPERGARTGAPPRGRAPGRASCARRPRRRRSPKTPRAGRCRPGSPRSPRGARPRRSPAGAPPRARRYSRAPGNTGTSGISSAKRSILSPSTRPRRARSGRSPRRSKASRIELASSCASRSSVLLVGDVDAPRSSSASCSERKCSGSLSTITPSKSKTAARKPMAPGWTKPPGRRTRPPPR